MRSDKRRGFTMIELLMVMLITMFVMVAASRVMATMVRQFKQQSKIAESSIESSIAMEIMRRDLSHAGFGVPYGILNGTLYNKTNWGVLNTYAEVINTPGSNYNDAPMNPQLVYAGKPGIPTFTPPVASGSGPAYLVIRSIFATESRSAGRFNIVYSNDADDPWTMNTWSDRYNLANTDNVILLSIKEDEKHHIGLVQDTGDPSKFYTTKPNIITHMLPSGNTEEKFYRYLAYAINNTSDSATLRAPFNRVDYFVSLDPAVIGLPKRCAPGTGVLMRGTMSQATGQLDPLVPMMDCVADMQVTFGLLTGGSVTSTDLTSFQNMILANRHAIWDRLKEIRVHILAHEGQVDPQYTQRETTINSGDYSFALASLPNYNADWLHYKWRAYTIEVRPYVLR